MDIDTTNKTKLSTAIITPTFIWCFLMPSIHLFSLISNILCIVVFCSSIFIKKPIAIYFICLLISDSITLLIGYIEMIDRESNMIDKSSLLCMFNEKIIHKITDFIYTFMGRFCLEWMLYKVLWTRASTILLAILSVQRSRTFFSLSYHETRLCAFFACISSIIIALTITCLEWIGVQYDKVENRKIYFEIFQSIIHKNSSKDFYSTYLSGNYNESITNYPCMMDLLPITVSSTTNQSNCSSNNISMEFYSLTRSFLSHRDPQIVEITSNLFTDLTVNDCNLSTNSLLMESIRIAKTTEFIGKLFEKRTCHVTFSYSLWLRLYSFLHSVSFTWNRRAIAIFFGNALPSFIVLLANLLSIKVIYFSESLKYLKQTARGKRRKRRLQHDLRAFLVILIESFSVIMISWGIPIFLTMYHCRSLYVLVMTTCPKIKDYLALFLFTDLFNSSTNSLLYSLSGRLFRTKFFCILKTIFTCGRGTLWNIKQRSLNTPNQTLNRQPSNSASINTNNKNNFAKRSASRSATCRRSERLSSPLMNNHPNNKVNNSIKTTIPVYKRINGQNRNISDDGSLSLGKGSDNQHGGKSSLSETESETIKKSKDIQLRKNSQTIKSYLINKVRSFSSTSSTNTKMNYPSTIVRSDKPKMRPKKNLFNTLLSKRQTATDLSLSSSSFTGSISYGSQRKYPLNNRYTSSKILHNNTGDNLSMIDNNIPENLTSL